MRKISLLVITICISSLWSSAQKAKVQTARNYFMEPYQQYDKAKEAIDEATIHEQSKGMAKTWYYRGLIYQALYKNEKYGNLCENCMMTAYDAFQKAMELEPENEWKDEILNARMPIITNFVFEQGVNAFKAKDFNTALTNFEAVHKMSPKDSSVVLNCAYSAERAGNAEKAKQYYSMLISMKYPDDGIYLNLSNIYKSEKDTAKALGFIRDGRTIYPDSLSLILAEINLLLSSGKKEEAANALNAATLKDPNNPSLYLALGSSYDNMANPHDADGKEIPKPKNYTEYLQKAEDSYKKGLVISPDNYELNFNLGALYFNQAAEMVNQANALKSNDDYNKAKIKFEQKFKDSMPFLEKALEKNPGKTADDNSIYQGTLNSLKQLYARTGETEKYEKIKALMEKK